MESFQERQRYYAEPVSFLNKIIIGVPPLVAVILVLIPLGFIESGAFYYPGYILSSIGLMALPIVKIFSLKPKLWIETLSVFFLYPFVSAMILLFVTGFQSPVLVAWVVVLILSFMNFGVYGFLFNSAMLLAIAFFDLVIRSSQDPIYLAVSVFYVAFTLTIGFMVAQVLNITGNAEKSLEISRAKESRQRDRLNAIMNSMDEGVLSMDRYGAIQLQNAKVLEILDTNSIEGKQFSDVFKLTDTNGDSVPLKALLSFKPVIRNDLIHMFSKREKINLQVAVSPVRTGYRGEQAEDYVMIIKDITKQKSLDDERDEFISVVSHELRTPVAVAEGSMSNLLLMEEKGMDKTHIFDAANAAYRQVMFLSRMINDLSTLSRAERGIGDNQEEIDLNEVLNTLHDNYLPEAEAKGLHLNMDVPARLPKVVQSRLYLEEALQNFVSNAIKYTQEGSVTLHAHKTKHGVECAISDTGIGISASDQHKIFDKFFRSEDYRTRETGGTGLGLYVVNKLAEKMGVKIEVKSRLNHGSKFSFILPLKKK